MPFIVKLWKWKIGEKSAWIWVFFQSVFNASPIVKPPVSFTLNTAQKRQHHLKNIGKFEEIYFAILILRLETFKADSQKQFQKINSWFSTLKKERNNKQISWQFSWIPIMNNQPEQGATNDLICLESAYPG